jgi:hypothetical protein
MGKQHRNRIVLWAITFLMFWGLYKTSSRGPWITTGISCILLFFLVKNRVRKYVASVLLVAVLVVLARPGIRDTIVGLYESTQDSSSALGSSYEYRHALIPAVMDAVSKDPARMLLGYGLGTFREIGLNIYFLNITQKWHTCDDNWALFVYETGYGGLLLISILLFKPLLMMVRSYRRLGRPEKHFMGVLFIGVAGFYFGLLSVAGYNWGQQGFMAWILISLSIVYPMLVSRDRQKAIQSRDSSEAELSIAAPETPMLLPVS